VSRRSTRQPRLPTAYPRSSGLAPPEQGYLAVMSNEYSETELEAIQAVVDRVSSYQDGAPGGTVLEELTAGLSEAGVAVEGEDLNRLGAAIEEAHGGVSAADVLG